MGRWFEELEPGLVIDHAVTNEASHPCDDEVDWAQRLLAAFDEAGGDTIGFEGLMVDGVVAARARAVLDSAGQHR